MSKKGQALIEAIAGLSLSALFFASCLKLWMTAVTDFKKEMQLRESEICTMSRASNCRADAGFVLITTLMHLTVLVFSTYLLISLFLAEEFRWKISNWCFENGLANVSASSSASSTDIVSIENEMNKAAPRVVQFQTYLNGPVRSETPETGLTESYYIIKWAATSKLNQNFFKTDDFTNHLKCGARKLCQNEKCVYSLIADKS